MGKYDGKSVVITGGTTGIGLATAKLFLSEGARVIATGRTAATIESAQKELGEGATVIHSDASSLSDIDSLSILVKENFGSLDALFVNAGLARFVPFEAMTEAIYNEMLDLNAKGPYFLIQKLAPMIVEGGSVVLTTSAADEKGIPNISAYGAAKAALRSMARTLAAEFLPRGIRVNAVSPGPIDTGIIHKVGFSKEQIEQVGAGMRDSTPMKRMGTSEEVAKAVVFLAFEATYTTGAELPVDGGSTQL